MFRRSNYTFKFSRWYSTLPEECQSEKKTGLVLGVYQDCNSKQTLTDIAEQYDHESGGQIRKYLERVSIPEGKAKVIHSINEQYYAAAIVGLGDPSKSYSETELIDTSKESIRLAAGAGARALQDNGVENIYLEGFRNPGAAAEGAKLAVWRYQDLKNKNRKKTECLVNFYKDGDEDWNRGTVKADSQNLARYLAEQPANIKTPMGFAQAAVEYLCPCGVHVDIKDRDWMIEKQMIPTLAISRGACEAPIFLEMNYCGSTEDDKPVILIGKGVTFDSGGLCLNPCENMAEHRGDVAGGAAIVGILKALSILNVPINVTGLVPLIENMPGGGAIKPGDLVVTKSGKSIKIENPAFAGRITLAASLIHAATYMPCFVIDIATMSSGARIAMGSAASPTFCTSDIVWKELKKAAAETGDRVWRMPFWEQYSKNMTALLSADVDNVGLGKGATLCKAAAFLLEFAPKVDFAHIDISGTGMEAEDCPIYYREGLMTGRPVRTVVQFLYQVACPQMTESPC